MQPSGPPSSGGGSGGNSPDLTESIFSSVAKHIGSGLGKMAENALTLGGAHAFAEDRKQKEQAQAEMLDSLHDRASQGYMPEAEDYRNWDNLGGKPEAISAVAQKAFTVGKERVESIERLEQMHQSGMLDDATYSAYAMAMYSDDPTANGMAKLAIANMQKLNFEQQKLNMQYGPQGAITGEHERQEGVKGQAADTKFGQQQQLEGEKHQYRSEENVQKGHIRDEQISRAAHLRQAAGAAGLTAQTLKASDNVTAAVGAAAGDPAQLKKVFGANIPEDGVSQDQAAVMISNANSNLAARPGMTFEKMTTDGGFTATISAPVDSYIPGMSSKGQQAYGVGVSQLVENYAARGGKIAPTAVADFRAKWVAATKIPDVTARLTAMNEALAILPPDLRDSLRDQLRNMGQQIGEQQAATAVNAPDDDTDESDDSTDTSDDGANE